ncbi:hypothetical protein NDA13_001413 [Ustilago tritici]|nr:hypothetical protein NDA13_001413 [Ustilago tritici]
MPPQPNDLHTANDPSLEDSSDNQAKQSRDNSKPSKPLLNLNDINKMNINTLQNMLTQSTLRKQAKISLYKIPSKHHTFLHEVAQLNDALKQVPKLITKNWYTWNPRLRDILSTWSPALKHLDGITKPGNKKFDQRLDGKLRMILQNNAKLIGQGNVNYLFMRPANAESWGLHELYSRLKKDLVSGRTPETRNLW